MSIYIDRDPFSDHCGKPVCSECQERAWSERHVCAARCQKCGRKVWSGNAFHHSCCDHPAGRRGDWHDVDIRQARNGQRSYFLPCHDCGAGVPIKHALVPDWAKRAEPHTDYSNDEHPCARCDSTLTEYHHFAPSAIFTDSDFWPGAWLCKRCHALWHSAMREALGHRLDTKRQCDWADDTRRTLPRWVGTAWEHIFIRGAS